MKKCNTCGSEMQDGDVFCKACGEQNPETPLEGNIMQQPAEAAPQKGKINLKKIISSALIIAIATIAGRFAGGFIANSFKNDKKHEQGIEKHIERMSEYKGGECVGDTYVSEHFNIEYTLGENWYMYTEEELAPYTANVRNSAISSGVETLKKQGISDELIEKWKKAVYAKTELGVYYVEDDLIAGEATIGVFSAYGADGISEKDIADIADGLEEAMYTTAKNKTRSEKIISGKKYIMLKGTMPMDGVDSEIVNAILVGYADDMISMISVKAVDGYEDVVIDGFLSDLKNCN